MRSRFSLLLAACNSLSAADRPGTVRDLIWAWGNPEMAKPGPHTAATFAEAGPAERARLLGVPNIVMAGQGLPNDNAKADALTKEVAGFKRLVWEITPDGTGLGPPFVYKDRIAQIRKLADKYPQIEGVLLDDMSTGKMNRGLQARAYPAYPPSAWRQIPGGEDMGRGLLDEPGPADDGRMFEREST